MRRRAFRLLESQAESLRPAGPAPKFACSLRALINWPGAQPGQTEISDPASLYQLAYMQVHPRPSNLHGGLRSAGREPVRAPASAKATETCARAMAACQQSIVNGEVYIFH